jgi:hypothetical protein
LATSPLVGYPDPDNQQPRTILMTGPVELAPGEFVLFVSQGGTEEQDSRFLALLKEAWERVPQVARRVILEHHRTAYHCHPKVILGARINSMWPIAMAGPEGSLLWCDLLRILDLPGKDSWAVLVIGEELAHAYLKASQHPSHVSKPPSDSPASPEYQAWDKAREDAMKDVLYQWPFDRAEHERILAWVIETKGGLKAGDAAPSPPSPQL